MRFANLVTLLAPLALAACDPGDDTAGMNDMPMADGQMADGRMPKGAANMPTMESDGAMRTASADGTVTAIDPDAGTITIEHGPVAEIAWPPMTMAFEADEQLRNDVAVGDEISFEFRAGPEGSALTSITRK